LTNSKSSHNFIKEAKRIILFKLKILEYGGQEIERIFENLYLKFLYIFVIHFCFIYRERPVLSIARTRYPFIYLSGDGRRCACGASWPARAASTLKPISYSPAVHA